jgi:hypothetical protein
VIGDPSIFKLTRKAWEGAGDFCLQGGRERRAGLLRRALEHFFVHFLMILLQQNNKRLFLFAAE